MCLSTVYRGPLPDAQQVICEYVTEVEVLPEGLRLYDITGTILDITGQVKKVDLIKNVIFVE